MGSQASGIRILQLVDLAAGPQARRGAEALARDLGAGFDVRTRTIGRGGDDSGVVAAVTRLRREGNGGRDGLGAAASLGVLDPRYGVIAWGRGAGVPALVHFAHSQKQPDLLIVSQRRLGRAVEFEELLPAADVILATPTGTVATLPVCIGMA